MATTITKLDKLVGKRIRRREDPRLITGTATYVDDVTMPGMHYAAIVRSPHAAAKIRSIDTSKAIGAPGVLAVYTGKDTAQVGGVPCGVDLPGLRKPHHNILAIDRVYFSGHPVAVVVARDRYLAADAADRIEVDYDVLPAVADPEKALSARAAATSIRLSRKPTSSSGSASPASVSFPARWKPAASSPSGAKPTAR